MYEQKKLGNQKAWKHWKSPIGKKKNGSSTVKKKKKKKKRVKV